MAYEYTLERLWFNPEINFHVHKFQAPYKFRITKDRLLKCIDTIQDIQERGYDTEPNYGLQVFMSYIKFKTGKSVNELFEITFEDTEEDTVEAFFVDQENLPLSLIS